MVILNLIIVTFDTLIFFTHTIQCAETEKKEEKYITTEKNDVHELSYSVDKNEDGGNILFDIASSCLPETNASETPVDYMLKMMVLQKEYECAQAAWQNMQNRWFKLKLEDIRPLLEESAINPRQRLRSFIGNKIMDEKSQIKKYKKILDTQLKQIHNLDILIEAIWSDMIEIWHKNMLIFQDSQQIWNDIENNDFDMSNWTCIFETCKKLGARSCEMKIVRENISEECHVVQAKKLDMQIVNNSEETSESDFLKNEILDKLSIQMLIEKIKNFLHELTSIIFEQQEAMSNLKLKIEVISWWILYKDAFDLNCKLEELEENLKYANSMWKYIVEIRAEFEFSVFQYEKPKHHLTQKISTLGINSEFSSIRSSILDNTSTKPIFLWDLISTKNAMEIEIKNMLSFAEFANITIKDLQTEEKNLLDILSNKLK